VVIASRSGAEVNTSRPESGVSTIYVETSCVLGIEDGEVRIYGILGRGQKELLVVTRRIRHKSSLLQKKTQSSAKTKLKAAKI
jgi:hypothetical protein